MSCASVWMSFVFCLFGEKWDKLISVDVKGATRIHDRFWCMYRTQDNMNTSKLLNKLFAFTSSLNCHFIYFFLLWRRLKELYKHAGRAVSSDAPHVSSGAGTHFHSCSRSLIASFFRPYFSLKLAASRTSARCTADPGWERERERTGRRLHARPAHVFVPSVLVTGHKPAQTGSDRWPVWRPRWRCRCLLRGSTSSPELRSEEATATFRCRATQEKCRTKKVQTDSPSPICAWTLQWTSEHHTLSLRDLRAKIKS